MQDTLRIVAALITFAFCAYLLISAIDREHNRNLQSEIDLKRMEILKQESLLECVHRRGNAMPAPLPYSPKPVKPQAKPDIMVNYAYNI